MSWPRDTGGGGAGDVTKTELAQPDGSTLVGNVGLGGIPETVATALANIQNVRRADISNIMTQDGVMIVGTGDSLLANAIDFGPGTDVAGNAYDNPQGMMSWAFMMRDACYASDPFFVSSDDLVISGTVAGFNQAPEYLFPFNNRYKQFLAGEGDVVGIGVQNVPRRIYTTVTLLFATSMLGNACGNVDVYVDDVFNKTINLDGSTRQYNGTEMVSVPVPNGRISLRNFKNPDGTAPATPVGAFILGITHRNVTVKMTGHGGWTSKNILDDFDQRIGQYAPDVLFMVIGANDMNSQTPGEQQTPDEYYANVTEIVARARALKPLCEVVLMSAPPAAIAGAESKTSIVPWANQPVYAWLKKLQQVAVECNGFYLDLYDLLGPMPPEQYRYDAIHFNKSGNNIVYRAVKNLVFMSLPESREVYADATYNCSGNRETPYALTSYDGALVTHNGINWVITSDPGGIVGRVFKPGSDDSEIEFLFSVSHYVVSFEQYGKAGPWLMPRPYISYVLNQGPMGRAGYVIGNASVSPIAPITLADLTGCSFFIKFALRSK